MRAMLQLAIIIMMHRRHHMPAAHARTHAVTRAVAYLGGRPMLQARKHPVVCTRPDKQSALLGWPRATHTHKRGRARTHARTCALTTSLQDA